MAALVDTRFARPALYGALITFAMFWTMQLLIVGGRYAADQGESLATVDFVRLKKDSDMETRERCVSLYGNAVTPPSDRTLTGRSADCSAWVRA